MKLERIIDKNNLPASIDFRVGHLLLVDKPLEWTSFDIVNKIRFAVRHRLQVKKFKVGHAGTLDPLATGLLLVCIGKYTKQIEQLQGLSKTYDATLKLGYTTASYDAEQEEVFQAAADHVDEDMIEQALRKYRGDIMQQPPMFSAIKKDGQALYKLARQGKKIDVPARAVQIHSLECSRYESPYIDISVDCSKGTYIRSLAHDIGQTLGVGAYLTQLRRTTIETYDVENALDIADIVEYISAVKLMDTDCQ